MKKEKLYSNGDLAEYTGKSQVIYGSVFYEILMLEGHLEGHLKVTVRVPKNAGLGA
jgi:hypothetical protein